jgi:hypothetical protein
MDLRSQDWSNDPHPRPLPGRERGPATPWSPPTDDQLTWFVPGNGFPLRPTPFDFTFEIQAFAFGVSRALESLYFPLYELRARLMDGMLYFASVPSAMAEADLEGQLQRLRYSAFRFTRDIRSAWEPTIRREVEEHNERFDSFPPAGATAQEVSEGLRTLQRVRANQWFAPTRAIFAPAALLQQGIGQTTPEEAAVVVKEALDVVGVQGAAAVRAAIGRVAERLVEADCVGSPADVDWLELAEVRAALEHGGDRRAVVAQRKRPLTPALSPEGRGDGTPTIGPPLAANAPRMHLLRETLALIGGGR